MKRALLGLVGVFLFILAGASYPAHGEDNKLDFDQGPSASEVLLRARESVEREERNGSRPVMARAAAMEAIVPLSARVQPVGNSKYGRTLGSVLGPFQPRILESQPYRSAVELVDPIKVLPPDVQAPLTAEWNAIENVKQGLLSTAKTLDDDDGRLYDDAVKINDETAKLQKRLDDLNAEIDSYNQQCAGQPVNQPCEDWRARLVAAKNQLDLDIDAHNKRVDAWNDRYNALAVRAKTQESDVVSWEATIGTFIASATAALEDAKVTTVRVQAQGANPPVQKSGLAAFREACALGRVSNCWRN